MADRREHEDALRRLADSRGELFELAPAALALAALDHAEVALDLAQLYARTDQPDAALELLVTLSISGDASVARRARALQWRITLAPRHAWLWLQASWRSVAGDRPLPELAPGGKPRLERLGLRFDPEQ